MENNYSTTWFATFMDSINPQQTAHEVNFLIQQLPQPEYQTMLDVCCGTGRHAALLSEHGYHVTGIDVNHDALNQARTTVPNGVFLQHDMRQIDQFDTTFDAIICLWQSFGYFDSPTNADIMRMFSQKLNPHGRLILDIYHRDCFAQMLGRREFVHAGRSIIETKTMHADRLHVELVYDDQHRDVFEWQVFSPDEITKLAKACGFTLILACTGFDASKPPASTSPRMQLLFEFDNQ